MEFQKSALASLSKTPKNEPAKPCTVIRANVEFRDENGNTLKDILKKYPNGTLKRVRIE